MPLSFTLAYTLGVTLAAVLIDAVVGDPAFVWRRLPHPAALIGRLIGALDRTLNGGAARRAKGIVAIAVVVVLAGGIGGAITAVLASYAWGWLIEAILISVLIAERSLLQHFRAVEGPLARHDLEGARAALAQIVGRDVSVLDDAGIARASIESLAENASDGVIAPVFWAALFGLPGILIYKAVNTADSMIGHRDERYEDFGWASARLDDVLNLIPARLTGVLICIAAHFTPEASVRGAFAVLRRDARKHASPNAGFPEAAAAGALGLRLGGPRVYDGARDDAPWMGDGSTEATVGDMTAAGKLAVATFILVGMLLLILWLSLSR